MSERVSSECRRRLPTRRQCLCAGVAAGLGAVGAFAATGATAAAGSDADSAAAERLLRAGGLVVAMRHAIAPGTFDPPGFRLGDCSSQRNLSDEGRAQARRIGAWFTARSLRPAHVRSSPWCRCLDTARLAFGSADAWPALGSPRAGSAGDNAAGLHALRQSLAAASVQPGRFEVWVTHMFVLAELVGTNAASGEGLLLQADAAGALRVLGRLPPA